MEKLLTPKSVAELLGLSPKTIAVWARSGRLPCLKLSVGRRKSVIRFSPKDIDAWLKKRKATRTI